MKKASILIVFILSTNFLFAQQKIKVDPLQLMQIQIPINPNDTVWRNFQMQPSQFKGAPFFIADFHAPFYSKEETETIKQQLDKILNPDRYFLSQEDYYKSFQSFSERLKNKK